MNFRSNAAKVELIKAFSTPFDNAVATARTCYNSKVIYDEDVRKNEKAAALRDKIASSTYKAGHHTVWQHAHFQFAISGVSRHALWSFFHAHPFYNSEQVSQRYVAVKPGSCIQPQFDKNSSNEIFDNCINRQMAVYKELVSMLKVAASEVYYEIFPARKKNPLLPKWEKEIDKKCQEVARYVLPIGTFANLYHTISGLTLHRYNKIAQIYDCAAEQKMIINGMVDLVNKFDPQFFKNIEKSIDEEQILEAGLWQQYQQKSDARQFIAEFDENLGGFSSKLISSTNNAVQVLARSVREIFALSSSQLSDEKAVALVLNPQKNPYLSESLNLSSLSKINKVLDLVNFSFAKKISHSADSQAQRHRMICGPRPLLISHLTDCEYDFITPKLLYHPLAERALSAYNTEMHRCFDDIRSLIKAGEKWQNWQYLLPNAFPVRYSDSASLLDLHHKWRLRLCYNAQEEIWQNSLDEVSQVSELFPQIGKYLLPPCGARFLAQRNPFCPEGPRFCGVKVWTLPISNYDRLL